MSTIEEIKHEGYIWYRNKGQFYIVSEHLFRPFFTAKKNEKKVLRSR